MLVQHITDYIIMNPSDIETNNNIIVYEERKLCNSRCLYFTVNFIIHCTILGSVILIMFVILIFLIILII